MTDIDNYDGDADATVLMTMHAAKGLEFPVVLLPGFEDGIFPGYQTMFDPVELEEDRRLCYVAVTRAREQLYITRAQSRMLYGKTNRNAPSRFIADIPQNLTEEIDRSTHSSGFGSDFGGGRYGGGYGESRYGGYGGQSSFGNTGGYSYTASRSTTNERKPSAFTQQVSRPAAASRMTVGSTTPKTAPATGGCAFKVGDVVTHASFGTGKIVNATAMAGDTLLVIDFDKAGQKKLMANYAKLTKI